MMDLVKIPYNYEDLSLIEKTNISEEDPLSSIQTAVAENKIKRTESKETCHSDTTLLRSSSLISSVVSKHGTLTRQFSPSVGLQARAQSCENTGISQ